MNSNLASVVLVVYIIYAVYLNAVLTAHKFYCCIPICWGLFTFQVLSSRDDVGVLVTNKTEDQILRKGKFRAYEEFDFAKPGNTPSETLTYAEGAVLRLPTNISAEKLFPILQELEMPVKLTNDGRVIEMTQAYTVVKKKCA